MPTISVIVPVYRVEPYLHRCVDSILAQTFTDFELILVDDGSPDRCGEICDEYAAKDSRIHVIHQDNGGLSAARNAGIDWVFANSDSEWITFVDSDDWVHLEYLHQLFLAVTETGSGASCCLYTRVSPDGRELDQPKKQPEREILLFSDYFSKTGWGYTPFIACAKLYNRASFLGIRFPQGKVAEDLFTTYKLLFSCNAITRVNSVLYNYYQSVDSIMRKKWSPARLDEVQASDEILRFMHENGCKEAEATLYYRYLWVLRTQILMIREEKNKRYTKIEKMLQRKGRNLILFWSGNSISISRKTEDYEFFFPKLSWLYWTWRGIMAKLKRMIKQ